MAQGILPNVSFVDPAFDTEGNGTSADDHPLADIRLGERFIADTYHALDSAGYLDNTVLDRDLRRMGRVLRSRSAPRVVDDTNPANVDHTGDSTIPTDGSWSPTTGSSGSGCPPSWCPSWPPPGGHAGPFEHTSTLKLIESTFGLQSLTARDAHAQNLAEVLDQYVRQQGPGRRHPHQRQVLGPVNDPAAICGADSVQSVSPGPVRKGKPPGAPAAVLAAGMADGIWDGRVRQSLPQGAGRRGKQLTGGGHPRGGGRREREKSGSPGRVSAPGSHRIRTWTV